MAEFLAINPLTLSAAESPRFPFLNSLQTPSPRTQLNPNSRVSFSSKPSKTSCNNNSVFWALSSRSNEGPSRDYGFYNELEFEEVKEKTFGLEGNPVGENSPTESGSVPFDGGEGGDDKGEGDLIRVQGDADGDGNDLKKDDDQGENEKFGDKRVRRGKQVIRRSNLLAKQVISIRSALSMGFVSQLWVDTTSWMVLFVEVRPNLLSGDSEKFLLEDISQVGDVVLVQDESVMDNEFKMIGLETLVGYKVVTPSQRNIGKVRGYTFCINSGAVEELELDSFGLSIIPSSLVSTYSLLVEDVLEVVSDAVVVHEAAALRIQRLSKGFLGNHNVRTSLDYDSEQSETYGPISRRRKSVGRKKPNQKEWDDEDNWDLPMDYL
ncbi:hypothetical protein LR48_Vigan503s003300 [Vigna angularis]|uniref:PRC-barrel domain-containing protein n=2 Tax=Phaseolus angularis TaxID=3914 RepID=A0A0L9TC87_PHAAN|nr:uncharacterized protein LOC108321314 [Vigna angularis]KAG2404499.1 uncharacterized protein HKW66_Vig0114210 [Vigna angularis]KOM28158.1 hypothetical protein LR48_Vigan503s003300 [Vigna angularis]BAT83900.1 hypothetical protein VIGAN_04114200 [Vigna angularis var. angularis]